MSYKFLEKVSSVMGANILSTMTSEGKHFVDIVSMFREIELYVSESSGNRHDVLCPWRENHSTNSDGTSSTSIFQDEETNRIGFKCQHEGCLNKTLGEVLKFLPEEIVSKYLPKNKTEILQNKISEVRKLDFISLKNLFNTPDEKCEWIVDGLLPASGTSIFSGKPKAGKTTLVRQVVIAVATGKPIFGRAVEQGPVLYLALEEKMSEVKKHFKELGASGEEAILTYAARAPENLIPQLREAVELHQPRLVVIDTLFKAARVKDNNSYSEVIGAIEPLEEIARQTGIHLLTVHHQNKSEREGTESLLGSQGIGGAFDTLVFVQREAVGGLRTIHTIQRYGQEMPKTELIFDLHSRSSSLGQQIETRQREGIESQIRSFFEVTGGTHLFGEVANQVIGTESNVRKALKGLKEKGMIEILGSGRKGDPHSYRLKTNVNPKF